MQNKFPDRKPPRPGIAEAIHAEIGNGVTWESNLHHILLRSPDPTKDLEEQLIDTDLQLTISSMGDHPDSEQAPLLAVPEEVPSGSNSSAGLAEKKEELLPGPDESSFQVEEIIPPAVKKAKAAKAKVKPKVQVEDKVKASELTQQEESDNRLKAPKAGKLVRKAAKSIRRQEEEEKKEISQHLALTESTLSPYTQWLKGLRGSEYVHPYDEDFAFAQGAGPAKEGISETFADLLASQGYKEQAVEMYMKLIEKYPEKSGFFAAKIEALQ